MKKLSITKHEDSILGKNTLKQTKEVKQSGYYRWTVQLFMRHKGKRIREIHYFWIINCPISLSATRFVLRQIANFDKKFSASQAELIGIAAFNGWKVVDDRSFSYVRIADLESND